MDEIKWYQEEITKVVNGQKNLTWLKLVYIRKSIKKISKRKVKGLRIALDFSFTCLLKSCQSVFLDYPTRQNLILIEQLLIYI